MKIKLLERCNNGREGCKAIHRKGAFTKKGVARPKSIDMHSNLLAIDARLKVYVHGFEHFTLIKSKDFIMY